MFGGDGDGFCGFLLVEVGELLFFFGLLEEGVEFFFDGGLPVACLEDFCALLCGGACGGKLAGEGEACLLHDVGYGVAACGEVGFAFG